MLAKRSKCTGCAACYCVCNNKCIEMRTDKAGFKYPYVNVSACVNCGKCIEACPILTPIRKVTCDQQGFILQNKDKRKLYESTSGAVFPELANYVLDKDGVVYGAAFDDEFQVKHIAVSKHEDMIRLKKSKYVQSEAKDIYTEVERNLLMDKYVCFSGTPCQVEGLMSYLGRDYEKLITVDVVCHGVASPMLWRKYIELMEKKGQIIDVCFRDKSKGYQYNQMRVQYNNGSSYLKGTEYDQMLRAFFSNICDRESCYDCSFKNIYHISDFTIWDSFDNKAFGVNFNENVGTSKMIIHSEKGKRVFDGIIQKFEYKEVNVDKLVASSYEMSHSVALNSKRGQFIEDMNVLSVEALFSKYFPVNAKVIIKKISRELLYRLGWYTEVRRLFNFFKKHK